MANQDPSKIKPFGPYDHPSVNDFIQAMGKTNAAKKGTVKKDANLSTEEVNRYKKIFTIMKDIVTPDPEAKRIGGTTAKTPMGAQIQKTQLFKGGKTGGGALLDGLLAALLLMPWKDVLMPLWKSITGMFSATKLFNLLKQSKLFTALEGVAKALGAGFDFAKGKVVKMFDTALDFLKNSKLVKALGSGLQSIGDWARGIGNSKWVKAIKDLSNSFKNIFSGMGKLFSNLVKPIKGIGSMVLKGGGMLFKMMGGIGKVLIPKLKFLPVVGSLFNFAVAIEAAGNGEYGRSIIEVIAGIAGLIPGAGTLVAGLINGGTLLYDLFSENKTGESTREVMGKGGTFLKDLFKGMWTGLKNVFSGLGDWVGGMFTGLVDWVKDTATSLMSDLTFGMSDDWFSGSSSTPKLTQKSAPEATTTVGNEKAVIVQPTESMLKETRDFRRHHLDLMGVIVNRLDNITAMMTDRPVPVGPRPVVTTRDSLQGDFYNR